jgi:hypothetical protein
MKLSRISNNKYIYKKNQNYSIKFFITSPSSPFYSIIVYILKDHLHSSSLSLSLSSSHPTLPLLFTSFRFIPYCLSRTQLFLDYQEKKILHLQPFMYEVPTAEWQRLCVYVTGVEPE